MESFELREGFLDLGVVFTDLRREDVLLGFISRHFDTERG